MIFGDEEKNELLFGCARFAENGFGDFFLIQRKTQKKYLRAFLHFGNCFFQKKVDNTRCSSWSRYYFVNLFSMRFELRAKEVFLLSAIFSILVTAFGVSLVYLIFLYPSGDQNIQNPANTPLSSSIATSGAITNTGNTSLLGVQSDIVRITKGVSPSVVSIIISRDVPVYKSDPW